MNAISVAVIGPYKSGKTSLVNKLQQRKEQRREVEGDVSFFSFRYGGRDVNLIDTPGDVDAPTLIASSLCISDAVMLCIAADSGINFQLGELVVLTDSLRIKNGLVCMTKVDTATAADIDKIKSNLSLLFKGTTLESFAIIETNINNDQTIADLRAKIAGFSYDQSKISMPFRLAIDGAFESKGSTIAVGTLLSGKISIHTDAIIAPTPFTKEISLSSVQVNQADVQSAEAGDRASVALKGVWPWDLPRGVEIRQPKSFKDLKSGTIRANVNKLYKFDISDGSRFTLVCNWQSTEITLSAVKREGNQLTANFASEKNICFDVNDRMILINKDLPIRTLRVIGRAEAL
jgi:selenocysteine-specific translation elongation factor